MSLINKAAMDRISASPGGLLDVFLAMELQMTVMRSQGQFTQMEFISDPSELVDGDLIPEVHLSLRRYRAPEE